MKRPLLITGGLFVLGEMTCRLMTFNTKYGLITFAAMILIIILCNRFMLTDKKSINLLLFLCFAGGMIWGYGVDGSKQRLNPGDYLKGEVYIEKVDSTDKGKKLMLSASGMKLLAYVDTDKMSGEGESKKTEIRKEKAEEPVNVKWKASETDGRMQGALEPGKYICVSGSLKEISGAANPGSMDMEEYYLGLGISWQLDIDELTGTKRKENALVNGLYHFRCYLRERICELYSDDSEAVLCTMLLGDKSGLATETKLLYQRSGIAHILAISGLHVALIAGAIEWLLSKLRLRKDVSAVVVIMVSVLYAVMTGLSSSTLRAVLMLVISKLAYLLKRTPDMPSVMMEALLIMTFINPDCIFSTSMLMSYMAVMGIWTGQVMYNTIYKKERFLKLPVKARGFLKVFIETVVMSISVNTWMLPLIMRSYYEVPVFSMLLNFIVVPLLTVVISVAALSVIFMRFGPVCELLVWICERLLAFYKTLCQVFLNIPGSVYVTGHIEMWQMLIIYSVLIAALVFMYLRFGDEKKKENTVHRKIIKSIVYVVICMSIMCLTAISVRVKNICSSEVVFLDVGQGDGAIIHEKASSFLKAAIPGGSCGRNYLVDCGSSSTDSTGQYTLVPALKYYGITRINISFVSHMDSDHVNGLIYLLENKELYGIEVERFAVASATDDSENYESLRRGLKGRIARYNTELIELRKGDRIGGKPGGRETEESVDESADNKVDKINDKSIDENVDENRDKSKVESLEKGVGDFEVLYPTGEESSEHNGNDYSLVLEYKTDKIDVLFTGDIGNEAEKDMVTGAGFKGNGGAGGEEVKRENVNSEETGKKNHNVIRILKCPHHGSRYSSSYELLEGFKPDITIISCGKNNMYGHPSKDTLERLRKSGSAIHRTDIEGAVIIGNL